MNAQAFRLGKDSGSGIALSLYRHQVDAIHAARAGANYVLTTGTGSGKSLSYIIPIVDQVMRQGSGGGIKAIVVYPMNAMANSQHIRTRQLAALSPTSRRTSGCRRKGQSRDALGSSNSCPSPRRLPVARHPTDRRRPRRVDQHGSQVVGSRCALVPSLHSPPQRRHTGPAGSV
jgi:hypothetical protein